MTTTSTLADLRNACGQADTAVQMWELEHGTKPHPEYHWRLKAAADAKSALRCAVAEKTGMWCWNVFATHGV